MTHETANLIRRLAGAAAPIRPLPSPWRRTALWCAISLPYLALLYAVLPRRGATVPLDERFVLEQAAALATGLTAAVAAFATVIPGYSRRVLLAPVAALAVWVANISRTCATEWEAAGSLPPVLIHWACLPTTLVAGVVPVAAILIMLRRGAPIAPRLTTALAALATAGVANFAVRFVHAFDSGLVVLAWHIAAVLLLSAMATSAADVVFSWRRLMTAAGALTSSHR